MITSERLRLKPITQSDIEWLRCTRNRYKDNFFDSSLITIEQQRAWYDRYMANEGRDQMFIIQLDNGTSIGTVALYNISVSDRTADFGRFLLLDEYRGRGYAEETVRCVLDYAMNTMKLHKIRVAVYLDNLDAVAIYARSGFSHTRPIILLEKTNTKLDWREPLSILSTNEEDSYDAASGPAGYESQVSNIQVS